MATEGQRTPRVVGERTYMADAAEAVLAKIRDANAAPVLATEIVGTNPLGTDAATSSVQMMDEAHCLLNLIAAGFRDNQDAYSRGEAGGYADNLGLLNSEIVAKGLEGVGSLIALAKFFSGRES